MEIIDIVNKTLKEALTKAVMQIADNYGHEREVRLPAGYCPKCKMYFILDKTYETLRRNGTPLCKVCDEKHI